MVRIGAAPAPTRWLSHRPGRDLARLIEVAALHGLVGEGRDLQTQRENLCRAIRFGEIDLQRADLHAYLRQSVFAQVMIDQPGYAGAVEAGKRGS